VLPVAVGTARGRDVGPVAAVAVKVRKETLASARMVLVTTAVQGVTRAAGAGAAAAVAAAAAEAAQGVATACDAARPEELGVTARERSAARTIAGAKTEAASRAQGEAIAKVVRQVKQNAAAKNAARAVTSAGRGAGVGPSQPAKGQAPAAV